MTPLLGADAARAVRSFPSAVTLAGGAQSNSGGTGRPSWRGDGFSQLEARKSPCLRLQPKLFSVSAPSCICDVRWPGARVAFLLANARCRRCVPPKGGKKASAVFEVDRADVLARLISCPLTVPASQYRTTISQVRSPRPEWQFADVILPRSGLALRRASIITGGKGRSALAGGREARAPAWLCSAAADTRRQIRGIGRRFPEGAGRALRQIGAAAALFRRLVTQAPRRWSQRQFTGVAADAARRTISEPAWRRLGITPRLRLSGCSRRALN